MELRAAKRVNADAWWETHAHSKDENPGLSLSFHPFIRPEERLDPHEKGGTSSVGDGAQVRV